MSSGTIADEWIGMPPKSTASWDKVTIYHEYGHAVMLEAYGRNRNNMPPKTYASGHYIFSETDPGFAMIEGWAEFMQAVVENNPNNLADVGMNIETNTWYNFAYGVISDSGDMDGNTVEGSIASIMWDIYDTPPVDDDILSLGFNLVFTVMRLDRPVSMLDFWNKWLNRYGATPGLAQIYNAYGIAIDSTPPGPVGSLISPTHTTGTWYKVNIVTVTWTAAAAVWGATLSSGTTIPALQPPMSRS